LDQFKKESVTSWQVLIFIATLYFYLWW
jgi:hypothetical protein